MRPARLGTRSLGTKGYVLSAYRRHGNSHEIVEQLLVGLQEWGEDECVVSQVQRECLPRPPTDHLDYIERYSF